MQNLTKKSMLPPPGKIIPLILCCFFALVIAVVVCPGIDLSVSGFFYTPGKGFMLDYNPAFQAVHWLATYGAWILAVLFFVAVIVAAVRRQSFLKLSTRSWLFLFLALVIGPGLIANLIFKDHWGRARPGQVTEFGGTQNFSPAIIPQPHAHKNGSFVAGDAAFGFFLPCFAYVLPRRSSRRPFWTGIVTGTGIGFLRISMGAHFLSDVLFAALVVLSSTAGIHAIMFGRAETRQYWREWIFRV